MRWFIFRLISEWWSWNFKPCPRMDVGYKCRAWQRGGCESCGRNFYRARR